MSRIVQLPFLSQKEEETILSVIEEDLKLQKEEETRIQKLRDDIASLTLKPCRNHVRTFYARCVILFGQIFDSLKMCPTCSQWICKRDRICCLDDYQWICKLCNVRKKLHINEKMLDVSLDPSNVLCVSFNARDGEMEQQFHHKQQNYLLPKEETDQDYQTPEMFQQETGEEKKDNGNTEEEQRQPQQNIHIPAAKFVAFYSSNKQETGQQNCQHNQKENEAEQQQQKQQSIGVQPVIDSPSQSPKKLIFKENPNVIAITQSFLQPIIPVATVNPINTLDDYDDGVTEITTDNGDSSSSSEDDSETSDNDDQEKNTSNQPKPILVYPCSSNHDGEETINLMLPQKCEEKTSFELDDDKFRALTKKNTLRNRANITASLRSLIDYNDDRVYKSDSLNSNMSDMRSIYSGSVMYTHDDVTGEIQMGVSYSDTDNTLKVSINKVRGLTPPNKIAENHTNPYVKTYLLPDWSKTTKKKTSVKKGVDPIFNEIIKYPIKRQELSKHTLKVGVWHNDFWRHNMFLGEVMLPLDKVDWSNPSDKWYGLKELSHDTSQLTDCGQLKVSLQFNITNDKKQMGDLVVTIISGHNLLQTELTCNPVVKCHLLPDYKKKFKTKVLKDSSDPEWNEQFVFDHLKLEDLCKNRVIELTVWNSTNNTKHYDFIGGLRLGPRPNHKKQLSYMDSSGNELSHWMSVVNTPGKCVEQLHTLRHNMDPLPMGVTSQQEVTSQNSFKAVSKTLPSGGSDSDNSSRQLVDTPVHIGEVRVMLQFVPDTNKSGKLKVWIRQASRLKTRYDNGSFVVCTLLPKGKYEKFKSTVIQNDENSLYNAKFQFDKITDVELSYDRVLEITIWEPHRNTNEFVGGVRLGPKPQAGSRMNSVGSEVNQWEMMMAHPKEWIDEWYPLVLLNKPQKV